MLHIPRDQIAVFSQTVMARVREQKQCSSKLCRAVGGGRKSRCDTYSVFVRCAKRRYWFDAVLVGLGVQVRGCRVVQ